ncbi:hypothetical protein M501DRAFT_942236 [Patellaria atrata CBS 101060]|uniref:PAS domain-containing protein n=1 Tax=Patellaria atrata CBS 101060 TaxID=1346257 RepID=A0A9P4VN14_9PEZI|nr:hypothetical protein M501DRAFT_942236 [Patellaria atrata CBS 101060]
METTFITIHDLSQDARILYSSDSIVDILGHTPDEVVNKSCWEFFHPDEIPLAREFHSRGVKLDKAAVLAYCQIRNRDGQWVGCECCFTVVYDVMVVCTSIYRRGMSSQKRAVEAPIVRRLFSSSPKDPRYHMLSHLSNKFKQTPLEQSHEPRAALFLNRFTRTLTIMYATSGVEQILGISGEAMKGRSFYYCIQENCLEDAVRCLESAKGNDSIAYLRFWFRDPRQDDAHESSDETGTETEGEQDTDAEMTDHRASDDDLQEGISRDTGELSTRRQVRNPTSSEPSSGRDRTSNSSRNTGSRSTTDSTETGNRNEQAGGPVELEAVVSCTSDGLVVILRRARPMIPISAQPPVQPAQLANGMFAAPWAPEPMFLPALPQPPAAYGAAFGFGAAFGQPVNMAYQNQPQYFGGPSRDDFMNSIRDVAVFAWALTGINGSLAQYSRGKPSGESQPKEFAVWAPENVPESSEGYHSGSTSAAQYQSPPGYPFGDPGLGGGGTGSNSGFN